MSADFLFKEESGQVLSCAFEVHNVLGKGLREKAYERALVREFQLRNIPFDQQKQFPVFYKDTQVDVFIPDLIAFDCLVIDAKTIDFISDNEIGQMLNYLRITGLKVGLVINFRNASVEYKRVSLNDPRNFPTPNLQS
ncbi:GxxExxY protein [Roseibacillus persicicus]|uniref:GxxExxY protein n=1 Tax=Roseibacillus persicicus TaxID=454148 RepID=UPI00398B71DD